MVINLKWCHEDSVLLLEGVGYLRVDDLNALEPDLLDCLHGSSQTKVHLLLDMSRVATLPSVQEWYQCDWLRSEKIGWILIIGLYQVQYQVLMTIVMQLMQQRNRFFPTRTAALLFLMRLDTSLPDTLHCPDIAD